MGTGWKLNPTNSCLCSSFTNRKQQIQISCLTMSAILLETDYLKAYFSLCHFISNNDESNITIYLLCITCPKRILYNCKDLDVCLQHQQLPVLYLLVIQTKRIIFHHLRAELGIRNSWNLVTKAYSFFYYLELAFSFPFSTKNLPLIIPH